MLDTNTVNFAIDKVASAWQQAAPQISKAGEEYVRFTIAKAIFEVPIWIVASVILFYGLKYFTKKLPDWQEAAVVGLALGYILFIITVGGSLFCLYNMALALWCPEMFTIHQIIGAAK